MFTNWFTSIIPQAKTAANINAGKNEDSYKARKNIREWTDGPPGKDRGFESQHYGRLLTPNCYLDEFDNDWKVFVYAYIYSFPHV